MALDAEREIHSKITREPGSRPSRLLRRLPAASGAAVPGVFVVLWSSAFIAGVIGVDAAPPLLLMFSRFAAAGLLLAAFARAVRAPWPRGRTLAHVAVSGLLVQAVQFGALYSALGMGLPAAVVALVQGLNPVVIAVLAARLLGERVNGRQWVGFGLGAAGVLLAVADRVAFSPWGVVLCAIGLLGLSLGTLYQKRFVPEMDVRSGTAVQFLVAAPPLGLLALLLETPRVSDWGAFGGSLGWMVAVNSIGAFVLLNTMLRRSSASRVSTLFFLTPSVTALMAFALVGQALHPLALMGLVLGAAGVLLANRR
ncbi:MULTISPECIES: DMT family transporter [Actinomadura]|uniref:DMT family transporter n=1 Tax=Actinomadura yumaensis TaxID=111807 RepID=A0ABW2CT63_9ACTN|nr:DMT family transporter [Actinomadura sp. J1-007]MWK39770.1 EamA family transporter [Actinomadura sp. J1-007]